MSSEPKVRSRADIAFLVDTTGSMKPCIEALKTSIQKLATSLGVGNSPVQWRAKIVGFRDAFVDSEWIVGLNHPFVTDAAALEAQATTLQARGGGAGAEEIPESGLDALWMLLHLTDWEAVGSTHRLIVVLTDAPAKPKMKASTTGLANPPDEALGAMAVAQFAAEGHFKLHIYAPTCPVWQILGKVPRSDYNDVSQGSTADVYLGLANLDWAKVITLIDSTVSQPVGLVGTYPATQPAQANASGPAPGPSAPASLPAVELPPSGPVKTVKAP